MASYGHEHVSRTWIWMAVLAAISIIGGVFALAAPLVATIAVVFLTGWFFLAQGVIQVFHAFKVRDWSGFFWSLGLGLLGLILGVMLLADPLAGAVSLTLIVAIAFLVSGGLKLFFSLHYKPLSGWVWVLVSGLVSLVLGIMILASLPASAQSILGILLGVELLSNGILFLFVALGLRQHDNQAGER